MLYSWGAGTAGVLLQCEDLDHSRPKPVPALPSQHGGDESLLLPSQHLRQGGLDTSGAHTLLLDRGRRGLWVCGTQLDPKQARRAGRRRNEASEEEKTKDAEVTDYFRPRYIDFQPISRTRIRQAVCGWDHSALVTEDGRIFTWGQARFGALGLSEEVLGKRTWVSEPTEVAGLDRIGGVTQAAAGFRHTLAVVRDRRLGSTSLLAWGTNRQGQLGLGDRDRRYEPTVSLEPEEPDLKILDIRTRWEFSVMLLSDGQVKVTGNNRHGQSGLPPSRNPVLDWRTVSELRDLVPKSDKVVEISCGWNHCVVRTRDGLLFGWGRADMGQLGPQEGKPRFMPVHRIQSPSASGDGGKSEAVEQVSCGAESTHILQDGVVWSTGWNEHGNLGVGDKENRLEFVRSSPEPPVEEKEPIDIRISSLVTGGASVFALCRPENSDDDDSDRGED